MLYVPGVTEVHRGISVVFTEASLLCCCALYKLTLYHSIVISMNTLDIGIAIEVDGVTLDISY